MGVRIRGTLTALRPATALDVDLLVGWHADPEVARYWGDKTFTPDQMRTRLRRRDVDGYIVEVDDEPIGYVQAWQGHDRTGGVDMFLIPGARGQGYGPDAARALARYLREREGWTRITTDPYVWNDGAVRAWERAGFRPVEERPEDEEHTAPWLLMVFDLRDPKGQTKGFDP